MEEEEDRQFLHMEEGVVEGQRRSVVVAGGRRFRRMVVVEGHIRYTGVGVEERRRPGNTQLIKKSRISGLPEEEEARRDLQSREAAVGRRKTGIL